MVQTTTSSAYGIYIMTPVEQITRYALIAVSTADFQHASNVPVAVPTAFVFKVCTAIQIMRHCHAHRSA
jgi:hypothetical protein